MKAAVILFLFAIATPAPAGDRDASTSTRSAQIHSDLDEEMPRLLRENNVPSVSIAQIENGQVVFSAAYGFQSPGVRASEATLYNIASMAKPISAEVVLRLASTGRLGLDEPMYRTWADPDIAKDPRRKLLTPRLALSHQTGFPNWRRETDGKLAFRFRPGTAFGYSGEGYEYVAHFAQLKTGTSFDDLAQKLVFDPIGMKDTAYTRRAWFAGRIAVPTNAKGEALTPEIPDSWTASDLVYTTANDYARFAIDVLRHQGLSTALAADRDRIQISRKKDMCPPANTAKCPDGVGMGMGWEIYEIDGHAFFMHSGMDDGVFTLGYLGLADRSGTIIFTNSANGPKLVLPILDRLGRNRSFVEFLKTHSGG